MSVNVYDPTNDELIPVAGATLYAEMPLGAIQAFDSTDIPSNFLEFKGQTVNRADYPDLWAHIVKNNLFGEGKFYGIGDGATTFTLADLRETSLKGYGETSRSVGAHVKSGGLGIGEFIDDRIQTHNHSYGDGYYYAHSHDFGVASGVGFKTFNYSTSQSTQNNSGRSGTTTEVKAVGVVWAVKARQTGLPIDLKAEISKAESYSTTEVRTNKTWIDGKPIYRKTVDVGNFPNANTKAVAHGVTNVADIVNIYGRATNGGTFLPLPYVYADATSSITLYATNVNIFIRTFEDRSSWQGVVTIEYTKTTD